MSGVLPTKIVKATRINPKILVLYGMPKVGKTGVVAKLKNCLIEDTEGGAEMYDCMRLPVTSIDGDVVRNEQGEITSIGFNKVFDQILQYGIDLQKAGKKVEFPYKFIVIDTLDKLEDYCELAATIKYKNSTIGKTFEGSSVLDLPQGAGYYHLRKEVIEQIEKMSKVCKYLILITHIKEKLLNKGGIDVSSKDISLTGKLGSMVCAKADVIGYLYRDTKKELMVSFETNESAVMGARFKRLAGRRFPFDWKEIYIEEEDLVNE